MSAKVSASVRRASAAALRSALTGLWKGRPSWRSVGVVSAYRKSSYSGQQGDCVGVAEAADGGRAVRDSKDTARPGIHCTALAWGSFIRGVKDAARP
ncbi:DUF397 domain-containing protein [Streptomyces sp. NBC_01233]|uniref:DUF397 domain-containing protein n=1 Tax=Streptomyces sp. NBC_01233 TaxID=2903787 RepID=UPI002E101CC8